MISEKSLRIFTFTESRKTRQKSQKDPQESTQIARTSYSNAQAKCERSEKPKNRGKREISSPKKVENTSGLCVCVFGCVCVCVCVLTCLFIAPPPSLIQQPVEKYLLNVREPNMMRAIVAIVDQNMRLEPL